MSVPFLPAWHPISNDCPRQDCCDRLIQGIIVARWADFVDGTALPDALGHESPGYRMSGETVGMGVHDGSSKERLTVDFPRGARRRVEATKIVFRHIYDARNQARYGIASLFEAIMANGCSGHTCTACA